MASDDSVGRSPEEWANALRAFVKVGGKDNPSNLENIIPRLVAVWLLAAFTAAASAIEGLFLFPLRVVQSFQENIGTLIAAFFQTPAEVLWGAARASAESFGQGLTGQTGPFQLVIGFVVALASLFILASYLGSGRTSNFFPGLPWDLPWPLGGGRDEDEDS